MDTCVQYVYTGPRAGLLCGFKVTNIILVPRQPPLLVCGYHARAYTPDVRYPLWANLAQIKRLQWLTGATQVLITKINALPGDCHTDDGWYHQNDGPDQPCRAVNADDVIAIIRAEVVA